MMLGTRRRGKRCRRPDRTPAGHAGGAVAGMGYFALATEKRRRMTMAGQAAAQADPADQVLHGDRIISAIKAAGIEYVLSVPDITTAAGILKPISEDNALRLVRVCKEDECLGIAMGLAMCGKRALILIQHTGLLDSMNAIGGVAVEFKQPICFMVGLLEREVDRPPRQSGRYRIRIIEPILDVLGIPHHLIDTDADIGVIRSGIDAAYRDNGPVAFLIGRPPVAS
jgi:sulfopyruvate decarboxylase TPP-binding subunit